MSGPSSTELSVVEAYDPAADSWATVASMPTARRHIAAATYGDKIYVLGDPPDYEPTDDKTVAAIAKARGEITRGWLLGHQNGRAVDG